MLLLAVCMVISLVLHAAEYYTWTCNNPTGNIYQHSIIPVCRSVTWNFKAAGFECQKLLNILWN